MYEGFLLYVIDVLESMANLIISLIGFTRLLLVGNLEH
jgi:hypothetical protein